ncbi:LysR family transcriptional regulator [Raoultella terrigena]|uniref:LysR family transcriptional regulator n=1 Tax=Raoultella terrigena TaxID=577 RepID=UPI000F4C5BD9|nr:LysR family transcriptional regulator [Raoultella terrigena]ROR98271.1 DNA-binding transcriptional LysR family regulator [Raoultella terrigena]
MDMFSSLQALVAVVEEGGFSSAGRRLSLATSSVTRQIDTLEQYLGTVLLVRSTRKVSLTGAGERYYQHACRIMADLTYANYEARDHSGMPRGILRASLPVSWSLQYLATLLPEFMKQYPLIRLELTFTDEVVDLAENRLDLSIRLGKISAQNVIAKKLLLQKRVLCASPGYLAEKGVPLLPADLRRHNCLLFSYSSGQTKWFFFRDKTEGVSVEGNLRCNNSQILRQAALGGQGIALLPDWLVNKDVQRGDLLALFPDIRVDVTADEDESAVYALYHPSRRDIKMVKLFVDFIYQFLNQQVAEETDIFCGKPG